MLTTTLALNGFPKVKNEDNDFLIIIDFTKDLYLLYEKKNRPVTCMIYIAMFCCHCIGLIHLNIVCLGDCFVILNKSKAWHLLVFNYAGKHRAKSVPLCSLQHWRQI